MASEGRKFRFSIDRGGTFTDIYAEVPGEPGYAGTAAAPDRYSSDPPPVTLRPDVSPRFRVMKLLSEDPANYADAPREGIRRMLEQVTGIPHPRDQAVDTSRIESIRMGTTVATNALLERKGETCVLVTTEGFGDLLHIGNQSRPAIFDLAIRVRHSGRAWPARPADLDAHCPPAPRSSVLGGG